MKLPSTRKHYYLSYKFMHRIFSFLLTFSFREKKKVYAFFELFYHCHKRSAVRMTENSHAQHCYFSCASKKSKEYKQKDKYKFIGQVEFLKASLHFYKGFFPYRLRKYQAF